MATTEAETNINADKTPAAMEMEAAGVVIPAGPRPGMAICSFWQGRVEIALRILAVMVRDTFIQAVFYRSLYSFCHVRYDQHSHTCTALHRWDLSLPS